MSCWRCSSFLGKKEFSGIQVFHFPSIRSRSVNEVDRRVILHTQKMVSMMYQKDLELEDLKESIFNMRKAFREAFKGQSPHKDHLQVPNFTFNLQIPTLSALLSVPEVLEFLGPTHFVDTSSVQSSRQILFFASLDISICLLYSTRRCISIGA